jgi:hypothetical protein
MLFFKTDLTMPTIRQRKWEPTKYIVPKYRSYF